VRRLWPLLAWACTPEPSPTPTTFSPSVTLDREVVGLVGQPVQLAPDAVNDAEQVRWWLGDGTTLTGATVSHVYAAPGHYAAAVEAVAPDGSAATDSFTVTITYPPLPSPPHHSAPLVADAVGGWLYAALPDFHEIVAVRTSDGAVVHRLEGCSHPRRLATAPLPDGTLIAATCEQGAPAVVLYTHQGETLQERGRLDLGHAARSPFAVVIDPELRVWVTTRGRYDDGATLLQLSDTGALEAEHPIGADLRGLGWADGLLRLSQHRSPDEGGRWWTFDPATTSLTPHLVAPDPGPDSDTSSRGVPSYLQALAISPDGRQLSLGGLRANRFRGLVRDGLPLTDETTVRADLRQLDLTDAGGLRAVARLDDRDLVSAIAYHPRGDWLYAAILGAGVIEVLDAATLALAGGPRDVGDGTSGLWVSPDGAQLWALTAFERELVRYPLTAGQPRPADLRLDLRPSTGEVLPADVLRGKAVFHDAADPRMSRDGYVSCASCHLDGEHDGRTWDFTDRSEGLRNTTSLLGMDERAGGPIHWSANFDEVQDFEHDVRGPQAGAGFLSEAQWAGPAGTTLGAPKAGLSEDLDALAAYVEQLAVLDLPSPRDTSEGEALFHSPELGCAACHPDGGTDSSWLGPGEPLLHDVGTLLPSSGERLGAPLLGLDTPGLRGLWASAPYLHDGRAATLREVLTTHNPLDAHGVTSTLSEAQLDALEAYLRGL
jgi:hypothetical protein